MSKKKQKQETRPFIAKDVKETAEQVWFAGLGALSVAEEEGSKLFKRLVESGKKFEQRVREEADTKVEDGASFFNRLVDAGEKLEGRVRGEVDGRVEDVKETIGGARENVEKAWQTIEERLRAMVESAMERVGIPSREEIVSLNENVKQLDQHVEKLKSRARAQAAPKSAAEITAAASDEGVQIVEKTLGKAEQTLVQLKPVGGGWYEVEKNGQVIDKVQGRTKAEALLQEYL